MMHSRQLACNLLSKQTLRVMYLCIKKQRRRCPAAAYTLVEIIFAMAVVGITFLALYSAMTMGFGMIRSSRENLNASQILEEKFETFRLYTLDQVVSNNFVLTNFVVPLPTGPANGLCNYTGVVTVGAAPITEPYGSDMRLITVSLTWMSNNRICTRSMSSFVSRNGLQNYIY